MGTYNLYIHGVPVGHEICGCDEELGYIKNFYNHDSEVKEAALMQIDILNGKSFYTYLHKKDVRNVNGRNGSYFGLTVSFQDKYCENVRMLYEILEAIYKQVCMGCLIKAEQKGERFIVKELGTAHIRGNLLATDAVKNAFRDNLGLLRLASLKGFLNSHGKLEFNLEEVDSPLFVETLKSNGINVSPEYIKARDTYVEIADVRSDLAKERGKNTQISNDNKLLSSSVDKLNVELANATSAAESKYIQQLNDLQEELDKSNSEKAELEERLDKAMQVLSLMKPHFQDLALLLDLEVPGQQKKREKGGKRWWKRIPDIELLVMSVLLFCSLLLLVFCFFTI